MRKLLVLLCLVGAPLAQADEKSHLAAADKLIEITNMRSALKSGLKATITPMMRSMRSQGAPESALLEMEQVINTWFDTEIKWPEIEPKIAELYKTKFTEAELKEITAFYMSPVGKKAQEQLPSLMQEAAAIGNTYAMSKQASLIAKLKPIKDRFAPKQ